jgi:hypothetical protein
MIQPSICDGCPHASDSYIQDDAKFQIVVVCDVDEHHVSELTVCPHGLRKELREGAPQGKEE